MVRSKIIFLFFVILFSAFAEDVDAKIIENLDFFLEMEMIEDEYLDIADESDSIYMGDDAKAGADE